MKRDADLYSCMVAMVVLFAIGLLAGCGMLDSHPGAVKSGMFSSDGKYYVYVHSRVLTTSISKKGGANSSQGIISYSLQAVECATGQKLYRKSVKLNDYPAVLDVRGDRVWLYCYQGDTPPMFHGPALYSLQQGKLIFSQKELRELNPGPGLAKVFMYYEAPEGEEGLGLDADDARTYLVDPDTGELRPAVADMRILERKNGPCYQVTRGSDRFSTTAGVRKHITMKPDRQSTADLIDPLLLALGSKDPSGIAEPTICEGAVLVLSSLTAGSPPRERQLSMLDTTDLSTRWNLLLPQEDQPIDNYGKERFAKAGDHLYVANASHLLTIDLPTGRIINSVLLNAD